MTLTNLQFFGILHILAFILAIERKQRRETNLFKHEKDYESHAKSSFMAFFYINVQGLVTAKNSAATFGAILVGMLRKSGCERT